MKRQAVSIVLAVFFALCVPNNSQGYQTADQFVLPIDGYNMSDSCLNWGGYNPDPQFSGKRHVADDYCVPIGTDVKAPANGRVKFTLYDPAGDILFPRYWYGLVVIEHTLPSGSKACSILGHVKARDNIVVGTEVGVGQVIADVIEYPPSSDHLHFRIYNGPFETPEVDGSVLATWCVGYVPEAMWPENYVNPLPILKMIGITTNLEYDSKFTDTYDGCGGKAVFGVPWSNGSNGAFVHQWPDADCTIAYPGTCSADALWIQDFIDVNNNNHWWQLVLNPEEGKVYPVHGRILQFWNSHWGYRDYGPPSSYERYMKDASDHIIAVQEFTKDGATRLIGVDTTIAWTRDYTNDYLQAVDQSISVPGYSLVLADSSEQVLPDPVPLPEEPLPAPALDPSADLDRDGVLNGIDNCPDITNPTQVDRNNNGVGDACDFPFRDATYFGLYKAYAGIPGGGYKWIVCVVEEGVSHEIIDAEVFEAETGINRMDLPDKPDFVKTSGFNLSFKEAVNRGFLEPILGPGFASPTIIYLTSAEAAEIWIGSPGYYHRSTINQRIEEMKAICEIKLSSSALVFSQAGGEKSFSVDNPNDCNFSASTDADWVQISPRSFHGLYPVSVAVQPNLSSSSRTETIIITGFQGATKEVSVAQEAIFMPVPSLAPKPPEALFLFDP